MKAIAAGIALIAVLSGAGLLWSYQLIQSPMSLPDSPVLLEVKSGQSLNSLLLELEAEGILQMPRILALWARWQVAWWQCAPQRCTVADESDVACVGFLYIPSRAIIVCRADLALLPSLAVA